MARMYPCQHGDLLYNTYGLAYCRCQSGYEGKYCDRRSSKLQDNNNDVGETHWWSNFFDSLRNMIWGPPPAAQPQVVMPSPQNTVNIVVRPPIINGPIGPAWDSVTVSSTTLTTGTSTESAHVNEANDFTFFIGFVIIVLLIFCISCASLAFCCWKIKNKKRRQRQEGQKKIDQTRNGNEMELQNSAVQQRPQTSANGNLDVNEMVECESQPPSYEQATASYVK